MEKKLTKGKNSNYEVELTFDQKEFDKARKKTLAQFGKNLKISGFRNGHIPDYIIEQNIQPEYLNIWLMEELVNSWLQLIVKENPQYKFIGEPYNFNKEEKEKTYKYTFKLDVYPEVDINDNKREKEKIKTLKVWVKNEEIEDAVINLKKNYAEYKDSDKIDLDTISKISLEFLNKDWEIKNTWHVYIWEQEFKEHEFHKTSFLKKKKDETLEFDYKEKDLPATFHYRNSKDDDKTTSKDIKKIRTKVLDIKKVVLPEMTEENIKKFFGDNADIKNETELKLEIKKSIIKSKEETELIKVIEEYIGKIRWWSLSVQIPQTLIEEELKTRLKNLEQKFGGKEKMEEYYKQLWEEKQNAFIWDIKKAASESLEKFFILQKICELLKLDIDRNKQEHLEIEKKLYEKLSWEKLNKEKKEGTTEKKASKWEKTKKKVAKK